MRKQREIFSKFIKETYGSDQIFMESDNEIRFLYPDKELRQQYNDKTINKVKEEFKTKFLEYIMKNPDDFISTYTITITDDNDEYPVVIIKF